MQVLDEVQAYILLSRYIESGALVPFSADRVFLQAVSVSKLLPPPSDIDKHIGDCIGYSVFLLIFLHQSSLIG
jgi:hypothetical protein